MGLRNFFLSPPSSPAQHNPGERRADGRWGSPARAGRLRSDSLTPGGTENAGVELHNTAGEQGKNGELSPNKGTVHHVSSESLNQLNLPKDLLMFAKRKSIDLTYAILLYTHYFQFQQLPLNITRVSLDATTQ